MTAARARLALVVATLAARATSTVEVCPRGARGAEQAEQSPDGSCEATLADTASREAAAPAAEAPGVALLQRLDGADLRKAARRQESRQPNICSGVGERLWKHLCDHWSAAIKEGVITNAADVCCDSIPKKCRSDRTCRNGGGCLVPSCLQQEWYLEQLEPNATRAFELFGHRSLGLADARRCFFATAQLPCAEVNASFEVHEAAIRVLVNSKAVELEATAFEVVSGLMDAPIAQQQGDQAHATQERSLLARRFHHEKSARDRGSSWFDQAVDAKQTI